VVGGAQRNGGGGEIERQWCRLLTRGRRW
jgi:hypothetical protein